MTRNFTIRVKRILKINPNMFEMIHVDIRYNFAINSRKLYIALIIF